MSWTLARFAVRIAGGIPRRITPSRGVPQRLDGLVLGGGADVDPRHYAAHSSAGVTAPILHRVPSRRRIDRTLARLRRLIGPAPAPLDAARDVLELELFERALQANIPVLGICRGAQLMNVHLGGTLHRELGHFYVDAPNPRTILPHKRVFIREDSLLGRVLHKRSAWVNSLHGQAVDRIGEGLDVVARERNGVVQAVELSSYRFVVGVQWHPEYLPQKGEQRRLFRELVKAAAEAAARGARWATTRVEGARHPGPGPEL